MSINFIVLGGTNHENGELEDSTKDRIIECYKQCSSIKNNNEIIIHFSGGLRHFNKDNIPHCELCNNFFTKISKNNYKTEMHIDNNNTVEEAIHFGNYFKGNNSIIKVITNDWHSERVKYLFNKVFYFYEIKNYEIVDVKSNYKDKDLIKNEKDKINQLTEKPYGLWKTWMINNYYINKIKLKLVNKNKQDGKTIINIRNENNEYFFDTKKFYWNTFKDIFYNKYFSNEIPPFFIYLDKEIVGFIGCKTIETNINDIGIMIFKKYQKYGLGKVSLAKFLEIYNNTYKNNYNTIVAKIFKKNIASYKVFISNNFKINENNTTKEIFYLTY
jgi:RimJ/RimL family protein N-acetyltransferase